MLLSRAARGAVAGVFGAGAITGAMLVGTAPTALADPPAGCTAADLASVASGVSSDTSTYLFNHPEVNAFFTGLKGRPSSEIRGDVQAYMDAHPQVKQDLQAIRQPLVDLKTRCQ